MSAKTYRSLRRHISSHPYRSPPARSLTISKQSEAEFVDHQFTKPSYRQVLPHCKNKHHGCCPGHRLFDFGSPENALDKHWINCGKPVDDSVESPVRFSCRGRFRASCPEVTTSCPEVTKSKAPKFLLDDQHPTCPPLFGRWAATDIGRASLPPATTLRP